VKADKLKLFSLRKTEREKEREERDNT